DLRAAVAEVRSEAAQYRTEAAELRKELQETRSQFASSGPPAQSSSYAGVSALPPSSKPIGESVKGETENRIDILEETTQLLNSKVSDQYQTKIESASKYRVRLSGIVLLNLFDNRGTSDSTDVPTWATPSGPLDPKGTFGASLRQSQLGLEIFGPRLAGART